MAKHGDTLPYLLQVRKSQRSEFLMPKLKPNKPYTKQELCDWLGYVPAWMAKYTDEASFGAKFRKGWFSPCTRCAMKFIRPRAINYWIEKLVKEFGKDQTTGTVSYNAEIIVVQNDVCRITIMPYMDELDPNNEAMQYIVLIIMREAPVSIRALYDSFRKHKLV